MKKLFIVLAASVGFVACGDNSGTDRDPGVSIDSPITAPPTNEPDNTRSETDSATINSGGAQSDSTLRDDESYDGGESNSPGKTGTDDDVSR